MPATDLTVPAGFGAGCGRGRAVGGCSLSRIARNVRTRGDSWKGSAAIVCFSSATKGFIKSQLNVAYPLLMSGPRPSFARDPVTWSQHERVAQYRALAMRYRQMAEAVDRPFARDGLLELAQQCEAAAELCPTKRA